MPYFVYILKSNNNTLYTGLTNNLRRRIYDHNNGFNLSTKQLRPLKLIFFACFPNKKLAANFEQYLKSNSGRSFRNKHLIFSLQNEKLAEVYSA
jgi:putative endonuclease